MHIRAAGDSHDILMTKMKKASFSSCTGLSQRFRPFTQKELVSSRLVLFPPLVTPPFGGQQEIRVR